MKVFYIIVSCLFLCVGCFDSPVSEEYTPTKDAYYLEVDKSELSFKSTESSQALQVRSSQNWMFLDYASWLKLSQDYGSGDIEVDITALENISADTVRTNIFYIKSEENGWSCSKPIGVTQEAADAYIEFDKHQLEVSGSSGSERLNVKSNTIWELSYNADWLTYNVDANQSYVDFTFTENNTNKSRSTTAVFKGATTEKITITQNRANVSSSESILTFPQYGGAYEIKLESEVSWSIKVDQDCDWINVDPTTGSEGEYNITLATTPNWSTITRKSVVNVDIGSTTSLSITIVQDGVVLSVDKKNLAFKALGESKSVSVNSNVEWSVLSKPSWISIQLDEASKTIAVTAENNEDATDRAGSIVLGKEGLTYTANIDVTQKGKYFAINDESLAFGSKGGVMQLSVSTNDSWEIKTENGAEWLEFSQTSGEESLNVNITASDNPSVNPRGEVVTVLPLDCEPIDVIIRQEARYLTVDTYGVQFFPKGGEYTPIVISTDGVYEITKNVDWLTLDIDDDVLYITADVNETEYIRRGIIDITLTDLVEGKISLKIYVIQLAPGGVFGRDDYELDDSWDVDYDGIFNISVIGYVSDSNWDDNGDHGIILTIDGYTGDNNWNDFQGAGHIGKDDYTEDDGNDLNDGSGDIDKDDYAEDENYDEDKVEI